MATTVYTTDGTPSKPKADEIVYALDRNGKYKHTMHRVRRVDFTGEAVTYCTTWLRYGAVKSSTSDCAVWCENGCKPPVSAERSDLDYAAIAAAVALDKGFAGVEGAPKVTISNNVITLTYPSGTIVNLTATNG